jgi:hypothetical protein
MMPDANPPPVRSWDELKDSGLLWLINRVVFHPRGFALALVRDGAGDGGVVGWRLLGDGTEAWSMSLPEVAEFERAARTLALPREVDR